MADEKRYSIIDAKTGNIVNVIAWDGVSKWSPPDGCTAREAKADDQIYTPPDQDK